MTEYVASRPLALGRLRDLAALGKPRLSLLVVFTAASGVWLAPARPDFLRTALFLVATSALVAAANSLNCWLEREIDSRMRRTMARPLPAGRLEPRTALVFGSTLSVLSLAAIASTTNVLTTALGVLALFSYVLVYTPLKRFTPWAVVVGALPGALPPLMGWTAAAGQISIPGAFLFGILFLWQLPHFIAISIYLRDDFERGGIRVLPLVHGERAAQWCVFAGAIALAAYSLAAEPLGIAGRVYSIVALSLALPWVAVAIPVGGAGGDHWARRVFAASLLYLPLLVAFLVFDAT